MNATSRDENAAAAAREELLFTAFLKYFFARHRKVAENPKPEIRNPKEVRNPKREKQGRGRGLTAVRMAAPPHPGPLPIRWGEGDSRLVVQRCTRISGFGFLSDFEFRISDLPFCHG